MSNLIHKVADKVSNAIDSIKQHHGNDEKTSSNTSSSSHQHHHQQQQQKQYTPPADGSNDVGPAASALPEIDDNALPRVSNTAPINVPADRGRLILTPNIVNSPAELQPPASLRTVTVEDAVAQRNKKNDAGYIPWSLRPRLQGTTTIKVYHMYNKSYPAIDVEISNDYLQFQLTPTYLCAPPSKEQPHPKPFVYWNAAEPEFYKQQLPNPTMTIWLLIKNTTFSTGGYVKRRLVEECYRQNIQVWLMNPNRFDLSLSTTVGKAAAEGTTTDGSARPVVPPLINPRTGKRQLIYGNTAVDIPDAVIPRVGANVDYFGLAVMRQLEAMGVKVFNPSQSVEISRDKLFTHQILASSGIPIPKSMLSKLPFDLNLITEHFGYPVIMKAASGSKGEAVWKIDSKDELREIIKSDAIDVTKPLIFQQFLAATKGRDLRCFVVGDQLVASMMRIAASGFKANVHQGGSVQVVHPAEKLTLLSIATAKMCQLDFSGVDLLLDKNSYRICEVNSSPGFEGLENATEVDIAKVIIDHVREYVEGVQRNQSQVQELQQEPMLVPVQPEHLID